MPRSGPLITVGQKGTSPVKIQGHRQFGRTVASAVTGLVALATAAGTGSLAQAAAPSDELQEVTVTGSRIAKSGYTAPTPVTVLSAQLLEDTNATNIGAAVSQMPAFKATNTPTTNGFGSFNVGAQIVNLRGLGVNRNLVLVDGRRFAPVTREGTVDLNLIPSGLVERTDIVTGGASAAYGSDAIAGAVNVILDKKLTGIKGQVDYGTSWQGDGNDIHVALAGGDSFAAGRGHFILGGEYERQDGIGDCFTRPWCKGGAVVTNTGAGAVAGLPFQVRTDTGGGFQANPGGVINIINNGTAATAPLRGMFGNTTATGGVTFNSAGQPVAYTLGRPASGTTMGDGGDAVSSMTTTQLLVPVNRITTYGHADYNFTDDLHGFIEGSYAHVKGSTLQSRYFGTPITIFNDNPFIPAAIRAVPGVTAGLAAPASATPSLTRPTAASTAFNLQVLGQRRGESSSEATTYRVTFGLDGKLAGTWNWDTYYQYAHTDRDQIVQNNLVVGASRVINRPGSGGVEAPGALAYWTWANDAVYHPADAALPAAQRRIVCRATLSANAALAAAAAGCVPFNPFGDGRASQAALDYVYRNLLEQVNIDQHVVAVNAQGQLFDLWAGPLSVATGLEYRRDSTSTVHDTLSASFAYFQNFGADYRATQDVVEGYAEAELPLLKDVALARNLSLNAAARRTQYKTSGVGSYDQGPHSNKFDVNSWKVGLIWDPVDWARIRGTRSKDIRAPNFNELFQASASNFTAVLNRWAGNAAQFPAGLAGGNPDLGPEDATTTTIGVVLQPKWGWTERLRLSADYYDIRVNNYISTPGGAQNIVDRCFNLNDPLTCPLITFSAVGTNPQGNLAEIRNVNVNLQWLHTRGLDLEADYRLPLDAINSAFDGNLNLRLLATRTFESSTNLFGVVVDQVGTTGSAGGIPKWLVNLYSTYSNGPLSVTLSSRYIPSGLFSATNIGPDDPRYATFTNVGQQQTINGVTYAPINNNHVSSAFYFNLNGSYTLRQEGTRKLQVFASVNNLFNRIPPTAPSLTYPTNPTYFDQIGRFYRAGLRFNY
jgi:outer membrane receptor protein involved in Fe transport